MNVEPGNTYLLRLINIGAFAWHYFWIHDHTMKIAEVDGIWVEEAETDMIQVAAAQRYSLLTPRRMRPEPTTP